MLMIDSLNVLIVELNLFKTSSLSGNIIQHLVMLQKSTISLFSAPFLHKLVVKLTDKI